MITRRGTVLFAAVCALAACGNRKSSTPAVTDGTASTSAGDPEGHPMKEIQKQIASQFKVSPGDVEVEAIVEPAVPGLVPFVASLNPQKLGRSASSSGVLDGKKILTERAAMSAVARAWGYGAKRAVSANDVANIFSRIHSERERVRSITSEGMLTSFKANAFPELAAAAQLPSEEIVDGLPAVKYCITSNGSIPFSVVTAVFKPDFTVDLRVQPIGPSTEGRD